MSDELTLAVQLGDNADAEAQLALIKAASEFFNLVQHRITTAAAAAVAAHVSAGGQCEVSVTLPGAVFALAIIEADGKRERLLSGYCRTNPEPSAVN